MTSCPARSYTSCADSEQSFAKVFCWYFGLRVGALVFQVVERSPRTLSLTLALVSTPARKMLARSPTVLSPPFQNCFKPWLARLARRPGLCGDLFHGEGVRGGGANYAICTMPQNLEKSPHFHIIIHCVPYTLQLSLYSHLIYLGLFVSPGPTGLKFKAPYFFFIVTRIASASDD